MNRPRQFHRLLVATASAFAALCIAAPANAAIAIPTATWGTGAQSGTMECFTSECQTGVFPSGSQGPNEDNVLGLAASSSVSDGFGAASAHAALNAVPGLHMPHLYGQSIAAVNGVAYGTSWALDHYTYSGADTTKHLSISLTGSVTAPNTPTFNEIHGDVYVFSASELPSDPGTSNLSGYFGEIIHTYQASSLALGPSNSFAAGTIDINLTNGDAFYIFARLDTSAANGGSAISMNSLGLGFDSNAGLSAASMVPEPSEWAMLLAGLGLMGFAARNRARRR